jgi:uncharacterized protein with PIN domain
VVKKAELMPLQGKYYGTKIKVYHDSGYEHILELWIMEQREPSERELERCKKCNTNGCTECFCDSHYETKQSLESAVFIINAINKYNKN